MPELNWGVFEGLTGAATDNFEQLWRALVRRHFARYGEFRALANQPGVEFHLRLQSECELGAPPQWYGWQCRWWNLPSGTPIGTTRREKIEEAIKKTEEVLPELTDWVLCTRHTLTAGDQEWFYGLKSRMKLDLWPGTELEGLLTGPAETLRSTYFGELVLTPSILAGIRSRAVQDLRGRWIPEVHQAVDAERNLRRYLLSPEAWSGLAQLSEVLGTGVEVLTDADSVPSQVQTSVAEFREEAGAMQRRIEMSGAALESGDVDVLKQDLADLRPPRKMLDRVVRQLRATRSEASLDATNLLSDMYTAHAQLLELRTSISQRLVAVVADAGFGKTQLAAEVTEGRGGTPPGILLHGRDLSAGMGLDDLARRVTVGGRSVGSFELLVAAVNAAGQRAGRRIPIVIDGLNEAEDPRDWKGPLAALGLTVEEYDHVLVVCTLRSAFVGDALPEEVPQLEMVGFEHDTVEAIRRYFQHYLIDGADARIPFRLLNHPLTLRMFCEVTNPEREKWVGVESMPSSLTALFSRYLEHVGQRIQELSSRLQRYYASDVLSALNRIGSALWEEGSRSLDFGQVRRMLSDESRPWDQSIVRALEQHGVLIRLAGEESGHGALSVVHDALAGHLIADSIFETYRGGEFQSWLENSATRTNLFGEVGERHPLAHDIFRSLVGLSPRHRYRDQLWPLLEGSTRTNAILEAAWLEASLLDSDTVAEIAAEAIQPPPGRSDVFDRLWVTRAARSHPLDAEFLDSVLRPMAMADRDLRWTEWVRARQGEVLKDLKALERRWGEGRRERDRLRARWVMWTLTSTVRLLRDQATRTLYRFGCTDPEGLFNLALDSLDVNDPYVPERMLAAAYGVAMTLWANEGERGEVVRAALPVFVRDLVDKMFVPGAPHSTRHTLMRDSALGLVALARRIDPECMPPETQAFVSAFDHLPQPFPESGIEVPESVQENAKSAIHMDFGNYTLGTLIPDRGNYDYDHPVYREVRAQIDARIIDLGYETARFGPIDEAIARDAWRRGRREKPKVDRYGKKYSWVAFFEMYGLRRDRGTLPEWRRGQRTSHVDIDPSFPEPPEEWHPSLPNLFSNMPEEPRSWLADGPEPVYDHLLQVEGLADQTGPWVLLDGYVEQSNKADDRRVFTSLRGLFVPSDRVEEVRAQFASERRPTNRDIPDPRDEHYVYAGEIPWSTRFGSDLRDSDGRVTPDRREAFVRHDGTQWLPGIPVEVPSARFEWAGQPSSLNQVSGVVVPGPALCDRWNLSNRQGEWDLYDEEGLRASTYREFMADSDTFSSYLAYTRADLVRKYLDGTDQVLVWLIWGERDLHHRTALALAEELRDLYSDYLHVHAKSEVWIPEEDVES